MARTTTRIGSRGGTKGKRNIPYTSTTYSTQTIQIPGQTTKQTLSPQRREALEQQEQLLQQQRRLVEKAIEKREQWEAKQAKLSQLLQGAKHERQSNSQAYKTARKQYDRHLKTKKNVRRAVLREKDRLGEIKKRIARVKRSGIYLKTIEPKYISQKGKLYTKQLDGTYLRGTKKYSQHQLRAQRNQAEYQLARQAMLKQLESTSTREGTNTPEGTEWITVDYSKHNLPKIYKEGSKILVHKQPETVQNTQILLPLDYIRHALEKEEDKALQQKIIDKWGQPSTWKREEFLPTTTGVGRDKSRFINSFLPTKANKPRYQLFAGTAGEKLPDGRTRIKGEYYLGEEFKNYNLDQIYTERQKMLGYEPRAIHYKSKADSRLWAGAVAGTASFAVPGGAFWGGGKIGNLIDRYIPGKAERYYNMSDETNNKWLKALWYQQGRAWDNVHQQWMDSAERARNANVPVLSPLIGMGSEFIAGGVDKPESFTARQYGFMKGIKDTAPLLRYITKGKIGPTGQQIIGRGYDDSIDVGADLIEVVPKTPKGQRLSTAAALILLNYAIDAPGGLTSATYGSGKKDFKTGKLVVHTKEGITTFDREKLQGMTHPQILELTKNIGSASKIVDTYETRQVGGWAKHTLEYYQDGTWKHTTTYPNYKSIATGKTGKKTFTLETIRKGKKDVQQLPIQNYTTAPATFLRKQRKTTTRTESGRSKERQIDKSITTGGQDISFAIQYPSGHGKVGKLTTTQTAKKILEFKPKKLESFQAYLHRFTKKTGQKVTDFEIQALEKQYQWYNVQWNKGITDDVIQEELISKNIPLEAKGEESLIFRKTTPPKATRIEFTEKGITKSETIQPGEKIRPFDFAYRKKIPYNTYLPAHWAKHSKDLALYDPRYEAIFVNPRYIKQLKKKYKFLWKAKLQETLRHEAVHEQAYRQQLGSDTIAGIYETQKKTSRTLRKEHEINKLRTNEQYWQDPHEKIARLSEQQRMKPIDKFTFEFQKEFINKGRKIGESYARQDLTQIPKEVPVHIAPIELKNIQQNLQTYETVGFKKNTIARNLFTNLVKEAQKHGAVTKSDLRIAAAYANEQAQQQMQQQKIATKIQQQQKLDTRMQALTTVPTQTKIQATTEQKVSTLIPGKGEEYQDIDYEVRNEEGSLGIFDTKKEADLFRRALLQAGIKSIIRKKRDNPFKIRIRKKKKRRYGNILSRAL